MGFGINNFAILMNETEKKSQYPDVTAGTPLHRLIALARPTMTLN